MFESPGLLALVEAHKKLEQLTLTKKQLHFNKLASSNWSDLVYNGLYYEPLVKNLETYIDASQERVCGTVKIKVENNKISIIELESPNSLINKDIAMYAQQSSWTQTEANGFIKLHSMQQKIANSI
jgi:argininosuccinate synthase